MPSDARYVLTPRGRYAHGTTPILRKDGGREVEGELFALRTRLP